MSWLNLLQQPGHITEAVIHLNEAKDRMDQWSPKTEVSRFLFDALNKIQTEWVLHVADDTMREVKAFQTMILEGLEEGLATSFSTATNSKTLWNSSLR